MTSIPDNLVWAALTGPQRAHAEIRGGAARYLSGYSPLAAVRDWDDERAWDDLAALAGPGIVTLAGVGARVPAGWELLGSGDGYQMTARDVAAGSLDGVERLGPGDVPEMLDLVERTKPGPLAPRAVELGTFLGVRRGGKLAAMAGERIRVPGWTEIGTVCTDDSYRGQGLAGTLVRALTGVVRGRGDEVFLHVNQGNTGALRLYEKLGFLTRATTGFLAARVPGDRRESD
ncbi:GNAT family N-acetyltransferase [Paractinoplanes atraurantiacus]|uniref:FR47-like protein n=1 Tax=Paractinoplanes atraurantiacus TaxID=1036182 RepID=A0A285JWI3_9ACTN|nr:GNAT family N-acetyltransferase [Actinoplanes atraurantiacus]SNY64675.1 FR47-like protein [Actinoplanes atraurantiacus]